MYLPALTRTGTVRVEETLGSLGLESQIPIILFTFNNHCL